MKRFEPKEVIVSDRTFHIFPFGAFKAANLSGELAQIAIPLLTAITALPSSGEGENPLDRDLSELTPALASAFDSLSGDKVESLLKKLLTLFFYCAIFDARNHLVHILACCLHIPLFGEIAHTVDKSLLDKFKLGL